MNRYWKVIGVLGVLMAIAWGINLKGETEEVDLKALTAALKEVTEKNFEAMNAEDVEMAVSVIHPNSTAYSQALQSIKQLNEVYDLKYDLLSFKFISLDDKYAIARVKQRTMKIKGPKFRDNEVDIYNIYRQHEGDWKIWQTTILEITYLD